LRESAANFRACELWKRGTQTVLRGRGIESSSHAGKILDKALQEAGIDRDEVYVTNAVKHFKWEPRGKRRIHKKPNSMEITACKPWIEAEIDALKPEVIICLGATAAQALLGRDFKVSIQRGTWVSSPLASFVTATVHPSSLLRAPDEETRRLETKRFVEDLRLVHQALEKHKAA
jgi:DNA polymerase